MLYNGLNIWLSGAIAQKLEEEKFEGETPSETLHRLLKVTKPLPRKRAQIKAKEIKYDISDLEIGQAKIIDWREDDRGIKIDQTPIHRSIKNYADKTGRKFNCSYTALGIKVRRVE